MSIAKSNKLGKEGENLVVAVLKRCGFEAEINTDLTKKHDYDLVCKLDKKKFTIEVKFDFLAQKTSNLAIEYYNDKSDKPSGLTSTKADLWAHVILDCDNPTVWITSVRRLKEFVENKTPWKIITGGGDNNASLYLYKDELILTIFKKICTCPEEDVKKFIKAILKEK